MPRGAKEEFVMVSIPVWYMIFVIIPIGIIIISAIVYSTLSVINSLTLASRGAKEDRDEDV